MDLMDAERRAKSAVPFAPGTFGVSAIIDARSYPAGSNWLELDVPVEVNVTEYWPSFPSMRRIKAPVGRYRCARELCSYENQKDATAPYFLHWSFMLYKVEVVRDSGTPAVASPPPERFCPYCGHKRGAPHAPTCERYEPPEEERAVLADGPARRGRGRPHKAG
jgi:hypothetical protein